MTDTKIEVGSTSYTLNTFEWKRIFVGLAVAVAGAILTYVTAWLTGADFGMWTPIIVAAWSFIANIVRKWMSDNSGTTTETTTVTK